MAPSRHKKAAKRYQHIFFFVSVNERGQIVIPQKARELFGLSGGSRLVVLGDEAEGIALVNAEIFEEQLEFLKNSLGEC